MKIRQRGPGIARWGLIVLAVALLSNIAGSFSSSTRAQVPPSTSDEADIVVLVGDIDNFGFGWPTGFDVFSGKSTPVHPYPFKPGPTDPPGIDRIMVGTSYNGNPPAGADGYTGTTSRPDNLPKAIDIQYNLSGISVRSATLQMFVDDFQAPALRSKFQATLNGQRVPALEDVLNALNQTGPIGKLITVQLPAEFLPLVATGHLSLLIDDPTTGAGDGYAINFVRLLVNPRPPKQVGTISGKVTDATTGQPISGVVVSASGTVTAQTGNDGLYTLAGTPAGLAVITATKNGYSPQTLSADLVSGTSVALNFSLRPAPVATPSSQQCLAAPAGLVGWWPGDGNPNDIQNGNNGTLLGGVGFGTGSAGQAFSFTANGQGIKMPASASLALRDSITIEAWINPTSNVGPIVEYDTANSFGPHFWLYPSPDALYANLVDTAGNPHIIQASGVIVLGQFQHVAVTYSKSSGTASLYRNGNLVRQQDLGSFTMATNGALNIGLRDTPGSFNGTSFRGLIDEVSIYNRDLSTAEIQAIYAARNQGKCKTSPSPAPGAPVITSVSPIIATPTQTITINGKGFGSRNPYNGASDFLTFTDVTAGGWVAGCSGCWVTLNVTSWNDTQIVVSGFTGQYGSSGWVLSPGDQMQIRVGNPQFPGTAAASYNTAISAATSTTAGPSGLIGYWKFDETSGNIAFDNSGQGNNGAVKGAASWTTAGHLGGALTFDGKSTYVVTPVQFGQLSNGLTLMAWARHDDRSMTWSWVFSEDSSVDNHSQIGKMFATGETAWGLQGVGSVQTTGMNIADGQWHHIAGVWEKGVGLRLYIDGVLKASGSFTGALTAKKAIRIGAKNDDFPAEKWKGAIDDARIYNRALSQDEITAAMGGTGPGPAVTPTPAPTTQPTATPPPARQVDTTLAADERSVSPNGTVAVPIRLQKADHLGSLNFSLRYDPAVLKATSVDAGDLIGGALFQANIRDAGIVRFGVATQGLAGISGDGPVAYVTFTAVGAGGSTSSLFLSDVSATDSAGTRIGLSLRNGRVTVGSRLKGDYDGDGRLTAKDALAALKMSVGDLPEDLNLDMDGDGRITAEDARRILAAALSFAAPQASVGASASQTVRPNDGGQVSISGTGTALDRVRLVIPPQAIRGDVPVNFHLSLADGLQPAHTIPVGQANTLLTALGPTVNIEPSPSASLDQPVSVTIPLSSSRLPDGFDPQNVAVAVASRGESGGLTWELVDKVQVDPSAQYVTFQLKHFSWGTALIKEGFSDLTKKLAFDALKLPVVGLKEPGKVAGNIDKLAIAPMTKYFTTADKDNQDLKAATLKFVEGCAKIAFPELGIVMIGEKIVIGTGAAAVEYTLDEMYDAGNRQQQEAMIFGESPELILGDINNVYSQLPFFDSQAARNRGITPDNIGNKSLAEVREAWKFYGNEVRGFFGALNPNVSDLNATLDKAQPQIERYWQGKKIPAILAEMQSTIESEAGDIAQKFAERRQALGVTTVQTTPESSSALAVPLLGDLNAFTTQFKARDFNRVISLGNQATIEAALAKNLDIAVDTKLDKTGAYFPPEARWFGSGFGIELRNSLLVLKDQPGNGSDVTVWHETMHHLVKLSGGQPCLPEEAYMQLLENRVGWLTTLGPFEGRLKATPRPDEATLRTLWQGRADLWRGGNGPGMAQNLSGPYEWGDSGNTCREGNGKRVRLEPDYVQKMDKILGIDVNPNKICALYEQNYKIKICSNADGQVIYKLQWPPALNYTMRPTAPTTSFILDPGGVLYLSPDSVVGSVTRSVSWSDFPQEIRPGQEYGTILRSKIAVEKAARVTINHPMTGLEPWQAGGPPTETYSDIGSRDPLFNVIMGFQTSALVDPSQSIRPEPIFQYSPDSGKTWMPAMSVDESWKKYGDTGSRQQFAVTGNGIWSSHIAKYSPPSDTNPLPLTTAPVESKSSFRLRPDFKGDWPDKLVIAIQAKAAGVPGVTGGTADGIIVLTYVKQ